jgi:antirestriction protein ArdC
MPKSRMVDDRKTNLRQTPCGIIRIAALWPLCRYRHNAHWTGAGHRLKRETGTRFGDDAYAFEELIAEIGAAMVCSKLGIGDSVREENAAYIAAWLRILKKDKRAIMAAARLAQNAVEFLEDLQPSQAPMIDALAR